MLNNRGAHRPNYLVLCADAANLYAGARRSRCFLQPYHCEIWLHNSADPAIEHCPGRYHYYGDGWGGFIPMVKTDYTYDARKFHSHYPWRESSLTVGKLVGLDHPPSITGAAVMFAIAPSRTTRIDLLIAFYCTQF